MYLEKGKDGGGVGWGGVGGLVSLTEIHCILRQKKWDLQ